MAHLPLIDPATATGATADLLTQIRQRFGGVPNAHRAMANSTTLLQAFIGLHDTLRRGVISADAQVLIALTVAQANLCSYCLSAHSFVATQVRHLDPGQVDAARKGTGDDPRTAAILAFAAAVTDNRGGVGDDDIAATRAAGLTDEEVAEIIGHIALNVLTNYFNRTFQVDIDFPEVAA